MKRRILAAAVTAALLVPMMASAQSESPVPGSEPPLLGVDTMDVCLAITGPVTLLTAESLTQGIIDGTFVIEGLSTECETAVTTEPGASPGVEMPEASPQFSAAP
jgi:hypothetical protein